MKKQKDFLKIIVSEASLSKNSAEAYLELGNIALIEGNLVEAEKNYSAINEIDHCQRRYRKIKLFTSWEK